MKWTDITLAQFQQINRILGQDYNDAPEQKTFDLAEVIYGKDITNEPLITLDGYINGMGFLNEPVTKGKVQDTYILNGHTYKFRRGISDITTAQYMDFVEFSKNMTSHIVDIMGVLLIPDGHTYNDGYDMLQVRNDVGTMRYVDAQELALFMIGCVRDYMRNMVCYSAATILTTPKTPMKMRFKTVKELLRGWRNLASLIS